MFKISAATEELASPPLLSDVTDEVLGVGLCCCRETSPGRKVFAPTLRTPDGPVVVGRPAVLVVVPLGRRAALTLVVPAALLPTVVRGTGRATGVLAGTGGLGGAAFLVDAGVAVLAGTGAAVLRVAGWF